MNSILLTLLTALMLPLIVSAQTPRGNSICLDADTAVEGAVLTICNHEHGMAPLLQPRLYLRVFKDGRAEYETDPPYRNGYNGTSLIKKTFRLTEKELAEIIALGQASDFKRAEAAYPLFRRWDDSSLDTTLIFGNGIDAKKIMLKNFSTGHPENKLHYPASLIAMMERAEEIRERAMGIVRLVPSLDLCTLIKFREMYLGKKVSISANMESGETVLASLKIIDHGETLSEPDCSAEWKREFAAYTRIPVAYTGEGSTPADLKKTAVSIRGPRFEGRARVSVTGILRQEPDTDLAINAAYPPRYRFDIIKFNDAPQPVILPYQGRLELGWMYSDTIDYTPARGLRLSSPLQVPYHHAARIEWTNLPKFAHLLTRPARRQITFRTSGSTTAKIDTNRWNTDYMCEILEVK